MGSWGEKISSINNETLKFPKYVEEGFSSMAHTVDSTTSGEFIPNWDARENLNNLKTA